ncbi:DUF1660 family phage protein [Lactococcus petauri]|uniref:DUF1660 family phage protein n=1 Tax=Lactococcus petauri TaxID=1940789 RepID=UPI0025503C7B|nr:DUF1660 family phage protein [Lactococcus petauri]
MKYRCLMFGHKWVFDPTIHIRPVCKRCGEPNYTLDIIFKEQEHKIKMEIMQKECDEQHDRVKKRLGGLN